MKLIGILQWTRKLILKKIWNTHTQYLPKICNTLFNHIVSAECPVSAGDFRDQYIYSGKKKPKSMSPQTFLICFQKALCTVKILDHCYEKELYNNEAKVVIIFSCPSIHIQNYIQHGHHDFDSETSQDLKNFFKATIMLIKAKNLLIVMMEAKPPVATNPPVTLIFAAAAMIAITMVVTTDILLAHVTTATMLTIMIFCPMPSARLMIWQSWLTCWHKQKQLHQRFVPW